MDYQNTLKYLYESAPMFQQIGSKAYKPGLETTHRLDEHFGHPHQQFKTIHIAEPMERVPAHILSQPYYSPQGTG